MGFPRQEYWSGLPFPSLGDLLNPGIELVSLVSPTLQADSLPVEPLKKPFIFLREVNSVFLFCLRIHSYSHSDVNKYDKKGH